MKLSPPPLNYLAYAALIALAVVFAVNKSTKLRTTLGGKA